MSPTALAPCAGEPGTLTVAEPFLRHPSLPRVAALFSALMRQKGRAAMRRQPISEGRDGRREDARPWPGQHFLRGRGVTEWMARRAQLGPKDLVLDIGAGDGALTIPLAGRAGAVVAIEDDPALAEGLHTPRGRRGAAGFPGVAAPSRRLHGRGQSPVCHHHASAPPAAEPTGSMGHAVVLIERGAATHAVSLAGPGDRHLAHLVHHHVGAARVALLIRASPNRGRGRGCAGAASVLRSQARVGKCVWHLLEARTERPGPAAQAGAHGDFHARAVGAGTSRAALGPRGSAGVRDSEVVGAAVSGHAPARRPQPVAAGLAPPRPAWSLVSGVAEVHPPLRTPPPRPSIPDAAAIPLATVRPGKATRACWGDQSITVSTPGLAQAGPGPSVNGWWDGIALCPEPVPNGLTSGSCSPPSERVGSGSPPSFRPAVIWPLRRCGFGC